MASEKVFILFTILLDCSVLNIVQMEMLGVWSINPVAPNLSIVSNSETMKQYEFDDWECHFSARYVPFVCLTDGAARTFTAIPLFLPLP